MSVDASCTGGPPDQLVVSVTLKHDLAIVADFAYIGSILI